ncbi:HAD family hydrolase [Brevibacillus sp. SYSU BS000544]|uniref:HAD family hydrolase n=1 Tax=Brevibacillus sp. SYSU BS000544 TaxID=3416443 RepID=UPI003CE46CE1
MKLFVTDLDGTLLDSGKKVTQRDRLALQQVASEGIEICLASGRMDQELIYVMEEIGGVYHRISQNGAYVYTKEGKLLQSTTFDVEVAKELFQIALEYQFVSLVCIDQSIYIPQKTAESRLVENRMFAPFIEQPDILDRLTKEFSPCKLSFFGDLDKLKKLQKEVETRFPNGMDSFISDKDCLDLMPPGTSKGAGLGVLLQEIGMKPAEVACVGDAFNDLSMFEFTPHSFAMAHSPEEIRKKARHVVDSVADAVAAMVKS